jgi:glutathione synthase/RimK-type ligase-like ATP-grasp enzyme
MKLAYVVYTDSGPFAFADKEHDSLLEYLRANGLDIHKEAWSDESVHWQQYDCIILKSPWDYVAKTARFYAWLHTIEQQKIRLLNPAAIVKWNIDKHYLLDIVEAGLNVIPTMFIEKGETFTQEDFDDMETGRLVVKPCISGSSRNTFLLERADKSKIDSVNALLQQEAMMVQPYMPAIEEGEWSMVYFNGHFSHALIKTPAAKDFRSQPQYGGIVQAVTPGKQLLDIASEYVTQFAKGCLYARVDGLMVDGSFQLMELELIDPYLFMSTTTGGEERYYKAVKEMISFGFAQDH